MQSRKKKNRWGRFFDKALGYETALTITLNYGRPDVEGQRMFQNTYYNTMSYADIYQDIQARLATQSAYAECRIDVVGKLYCYETNYQEIAVNHRFPDLQSFGQFMQAYKLIPSNQFELRPN